MADNTYEIESCDGTKYTIPENETNNDTSIDLIGHGKPEYGINQNTNFLHMLEHFSCATEPTNPIRGQIWFYRETTEIEGVTSYTGTYKLRICKNPDGATIDKRWDNVPHVATTNDGTSPEYPTNGDLWYDSSTHKFKVYDGDLESWNIIGPADAVHSEHLFSASTFNATTRSTSYTYDSSLFQDVINDADPLYAKGSLNLVTLKIVAKEIPENDYNTELKSCAWIYKFTVQSVKVAESGPWVVSIVGAPNYELISTSDNTNWSASVYMEGSTVKVTVSAPTYTTGGRHVIVGFDSDIVRV